MGRASISIAITSNFNPNGIDSAIAKMEKLAVQATSLHGKFGKQLVDSGAQLGVASSRLEKWGKSVASIGDRLTAAVTIPMGIAAGAAIKCAMDIDTAWYSVRKTVDMTEEGYQRLKQGAIDLSNTQPVSAETILNIEALGGQLGITNENLESFAKVVSGLDIATNLDFETAATSLAQLRNITQMSEDDLDNFASALVDLGNHTATTEADIMNLALRFASAGHVAGMSNQDILGLSAALAGLGMKADAGGSALSQVINKISTDVAAGGENLQKWADLVGEAPEQFAEAWRSAPTEEFVKVLQEIGKEGADANEILNGLDITQIRQSDAMRRLASSGDLVTDSISRANQAWSENTALNEEVANRNESLASQFETIKNRITNAAAAFGEPIAKMTLQALDAIDPMITGVQDLANAFANADPFVQNFAFNLGAVAMAAGPVLSVTGRVMQVAGKFGKGIGRIMQQYGTYTEALNTNDVALMRNFAAQDTLATRMGLSRNQYVKAAGGIDEFTKRAAAATQAVKEEAESAEMGRIFTEAYTGALQEEGTTNAKAMKIAKKEVATRESKRAITKAGTEAVKDLNAAEIDNVLQTQRGKQALQEQTDAAKTSASTMTSLKGVLLGLGGIAATAALGMGIVAIATQLDRAHEKAQQFRDATVGLKSAVEGVSGAVGEQGASKTLSEYSNEVESLRIRQGELADTIRTTNSNASAQSSELTRAWQTIEKFANQSGLGATEHYQLERAIEAVNEACGTQFSVMDDGTNRIQDETGAILENTDAIRDNIEERKKQIELEAIESNLSGLYQQREDTLRELGDLYANHGKELQNDARIMEENSRILAEMNTLTDSNGKIIAGNEKRYGELANKLAENNSGLSEYSETTKELNQQLDAVNDSLGVEERRYEAVAGAVEGVGNSVRQWLTAEGWEAFNSGFGDSARDLDLLSKSCEDLGINVDQLGRLSHGTVNAMITGFTGTKESIVNALNATRDGRQLLAELGIAVDDFLAKFEGSEKFTTTFDQMGVDLVDFVAKCQEAGINFESLNALGSDQIRQLAANFHGSTDDIIQALKTIGPEGQVILDSLANNWAGSFSGATQGIIDSVVSMGDYTKSELMALASEFGIEGEKMTTAFMSALQEGLKPEQAAEFARRINEEFKGALDADAAAEAARAYAEAIGKGLGEKGALQAAIDALKEQLSGVDLTEQGQHARSTWLSGFNSGGGSGGEGGNPLKKFTNGIYSELDTLNYTVNEKGEIVGMGWDLGVTEGVQSGQGSVTGAFDGIVAAIMGVLLGGVGQAEGAGAETGSGYGSGVSNQGGTAEIAAMQTLGRLLAIWLAGITGAQQAGLRTGQAYGQGLASAAAPGIATVQAAISTILAVMQAGVGPATAAGQAMGRGHGQALAQMMLSAVTATQAAMTSITSAMRAGVSPATNAGRQMGTGFRNALQVSALPAVSSARSISNSAGAAFGSGRGAAAAGGTALGLAFANAVRSAGEVAISHARSIRAQVQSIFDSIPTTKTVTLNVKTNVQAAAKAALAGPSSAPLFQVGPGGTVTPFAGASRAAATAERAAMRIRATREANGATATVRALTSAATGRAAPVAIDYDALHRVVKGAMAEAMREAPPVSASIDGHRLMEFVDKGLARRGAMY